jgi:hypothetical protein
MANLEKSKTDKSQYDDIKIKWEDKCSTVLVGKTIKSVRYLYTAEKKDMCWTKRSLIIFFTDGTYIFPSSDDEGNNAGAFFTSIEDMEVIPAL